MSVTADVEEQINLDKKAIFLQLFRIYEQEFSDILEYVAPIKQNYSTTSNKIHELHLRVCAELENLVKEIGKDVKTSFDFDTDFQGKEIRDKKVAKILEKLDSKEKNIVTDLTLSKHPDFAYFLGVLDDEISLCSKMIKFCQDMEISPKKWDKRWFYIKPFGRTGQDGDGNIPNWRKNYNLIKHNKIEYYTKCSFLDLIYSFGAYYIALNYLIFGHNTKIKIEKIPFNDPTKNNLSYEYLENDISTSIFQVTSCCVNYDRDIHLYFMRHEQISDVEYKTIQSSIDEYNKNAISPYTNSEFTVGEHLYYSFFDFERVIINIDINDHTKNEFAWRKHHYIKFVNKS